MKRLGNLWPHVTAFDNLLLAYRKARRGKQAQPDVAAFTFNLESELLGLQRELLTGSYRPGGYRLFTIYERKPRLIAAAPFRDRVVHHALMNVVEPPLDRRFIHDSYACRLGKGVHRAVDRYQSWAQRYRYALKLDVQRYFPSIDHAILKEKLRRCLKDQAVLALFDSIIDTSPPHSEPITVWWPGDDLLTPLERRAGIPIGNLTSQFLANFYLDDLDHDLKERLRLPAYLRYVDDLFILDDDKERLRDVRATVSEVLTRERLRLHPHKAQITPTRQGLEVLGYRVFPTHRRLRTGNAHRFARRLRSFARGYAAGRLQWDDFNPAVQSWIGHARHADTGGLRAKIFSATLFQQGIRQ